MDTAVSIATTKSPEYPSESPFHPDSKYPEYPFGNCISKSPNYAYEAVRKSLQLLRLDEENFGSANWNPLKNTVKPGMTVVIKPNWVLSRHFGKKDVWSVITHPSVIRAITDYVWIALEGKGKIIIADAPQYNCNFAELMSISGTKELQNFYNTIDGPPIEIHDFRRYWSPRRHFPSMKQPVKGDPKGTQIVNLGTDSCAYGLQKIDRVYGAVYHRSETRRHHTGERQEYSLSKTILEADAVICIPKLKVHKKVGVTLNMKNFVGAATNTNFHTHFIIGSPSEGGDQHPDNTYDEKEKKIIAIERWMYDTFLAKQSIPLEYIHRSIFFLHGTFLKPFGIKVRKARRVFDAGAWHGNNTAWRFVVDLARAIVFADKKGEMHNHPVRNVFSIIDGIIAGDNKGPLEPDPKSAGVILASQNIISSDIVATRLMGLDYKKLKIFQNVLNQDKFDFGIKKVEDIPVYAEEEKLKNCLHDNKDPLFNFKPHPGWKNHIEIGPPKCANPNCTIAHL